MEASLLVKLVVSVVVGIIAIIGFFHMFARKKEVKDAEEALTLDIQKSQLDIETLEGVNTKMWKSINAKAEAVKVWEAIHTKADVSKVDDLTQLVGEVQRQNERQSEKIKAVDEKIGASEKNIGDKIDGLKESLNQYIPLMIKEGEKATKILEISTKNSADIENLKLRL